MEVNVEVVIRDAEAGDVAALKDIFRRASLSNAGDRESLLAHPEALDWPAAGAAGRRTRVAAVAGAVVGFVSTRALGAVCEVEDLFVAPEWMGRGVGRALLGDAVATAVTANLGRVEVTANHHALAFYRKAGFVAGFEVETEFGTGTRMHVTTPAPGSPGGSGRVGCE